MSQTDAERQLEQFQTRAWKSQIAMPSDNDLGIPSLDADMQAEHVQLPLLHWGERKGVINTGCWSFYVDDIAFRRARHEPVYLARTRCYATTELNLSVFDQTPPAIVIAHTYEKRMMAARWQSLGIRIFVDLCVPRHHRTISMLGVPVGWRAFSTRAWASRLDDLEDEYEFARSWAMGQPLMLVVGGGERARQLCLELPGTIWFAGYEPRKRKAADDFREEASLLTPAPQPESDDEPPDIEPPAEAPPNG